MSKGQVKTQDGRLFNLAPRKEIGLITCPGEAHSNPHIDKCGICAPRWGQIMSYAPPTVVQVTEGGFAVPSSDTKEVRVAFEAAEKAGLVQLVEVTEKWRGVTSSYFAYVKVPPPPSHCGMVGYGGVVKSCESCHHSMTRHDAIGCGEWVKGVPCGCKARRTL